MTQPVSVLFPNGKPEQADRDDSPIVKWAKAPDTGVVVEGVVVGAIRESQQRKFTRDGSKGDLLTRQDGSPLMQYWVTLENNSGAKTTVPFKGRLLGALKLNLLQKDLDDLHEGDHVRVEQVEWIGDARDFTVDVTAAPPF